MRLHDLKPAPGATKDRKRLGRGNASGQGTTAGKGTKGQKARTGGMKAGFRGMSSRNARLAKRRGFTNIFKKQFQIVNLQQLRRFEAGSTVSPATLAAAGLIDDAEKLVKLLGDGELTVALTVEGVTLSRSARDKVAAAGGTVPVPQEDSDASGSA